MSRVKPGYFTDFNAFLTCSSEIDMTQSLLARRERSRWIGFSEDDANRPKAKFSLQC
jgi:hypothetical protein